MTTPQSQDNFGRRTSDPPANLGVVIADLFNVLDKATAKEAATYRLSSMEYNLLWYCLDEECTATQLAQVLPVDGSRISRMVAILVDRGLLRRRRLRDDRRVVMLSLTEEGTEFVLQIWQNMQCYYSKLTEDTSEEEIRVFTSVVSRIVTNHTAMESSD